jgi:DedD protein
LGNSGIEEQATAPAVTDTAPEQHESSSDKGRYVVQVASFGSLANANKLSATLKSNGYSVMTHSVTADVGILHRVRVGPYASEAEAGSTVIDLEAKISGIKPRVMDLQPGKDAQITTPSDPLISWVVQVGSFSSAANAEQLVASLRLDGLSAYQEMISSSEADIYRVRIGPFLQREEAVRIERRVREKRSLDGVVMSAD